MIVEILMALFFIQPDTGLFMKMIGSCLGKDGLPKQFTRPIELVNDMVYSSGEPRPPANAGAGCISSKLCVFPRLTDDRHKELVSVKRELNKITKKSASSFRETADALEQNRKDDADPPPVTDKEKRAAAERQEKKKDLGPLAGQGVADISLYPEFMICTRCYDVELPFKPNECGACQAWHSVMPYVEWCTADRREPKKVSGGLRAKVYAAVRTKFNCGACDPVVCTGCGNLTIEYATGVKFDTPLPFMDDSLQGMKCPCCKSVNQFVHFKFYNRTERDWVLGDSEAIVKMINETTSTITNVGGDLVTRKTRHKFEHIFDGTGHALSLIHI